MTANLDKLMALQGAIASGEFSMDGELVASRGELAKDCANPMEMMLAAKLFMGKLEEKLEKTGVTTFTDVEMMPVKGLALSMGEYSICVMGNVSIFLETAKADFRGVFKTLGKEAGVV